jgi:hypothetical protein
MQPDAGDAAGNEIGIDLMLLGQFHRTGAGNDSVQTLVKVVNEVQVVDERLLFLY